MSQNLHDQNYRRLFSSPHMVRALFDGILPEGLREQLDLDSLAALPSNFVSTRQRDRRADCIWQVNRRDGESLYLLILLEHQSEADLIMSIRIMGYTALLYEDLMMRGAFKAENRLPAILPIVLYSGVSRWRVPTQVSDLLEPAPAGLRPYQPQMRYLLLDEGLLVEKGNLPDKNLAALLFRLEHNQGLEHSRKMLQTVLRLTKGPEFAELRKAFFLWVRHVLLPRSLPDTIDLSSATDLSEITTMLTTHTRDWGYYLRQEGHQKGLQEGIQEGHQKGLREGETQVLQRLLAKRFGPLSPEAVRVISAASSEQIEVWLDRLFDADSVDEVLRD